MNLLFDDENNENFLKKYLLVEISNVTYAFKIEYVKEILPIVDMFKIDNLDTNITGLINLKEQIIPVYDLRGFLCKEIHPLSIQQKFLILNVDEKIFAIIIDNVGEIFNIPDENISNLQCEETLDFLKTTAINNKPIVVIDASNFAEYIKIAKHISKISSLSVISNEDDAKKIQNRIALLNQNNHYELQENNFFNDKFIIIKLENEIYTFDICYVKKIKKIPVTAITKIPCVPDFILGITNFRGDYITILNIKSFLNIQSSKMKDKIDIVIIEVNNLHLAIVVDEILDIINLPIANLSDNTANENSFIIGDLPYINNQMVNMLNIEKLFSSENINIENFG